MTTREGAHDEAVQAGGTEPNTSLTAVVGVVSAILLFAIVVTLQAFFYRSERAEDQRKVVAVAPEELSQLRAQQEELLHTYKWVDPAKGVVAIPIERAMEIVVKEGGNVVPPVLGKPTPAPPAGRR